MPRDNRGRFCVDSEALRGRRLQIVRHHLDSGTRAGRKLAGELAERWGLDLGWTPMHSVEGGSLSIPETDPDAGRLLAALVLDGTKEAA